MSNTTFDCGNGVFVPSSALCNSVDDCFNSADEHNCGRYSVQYLSSCTECKNCRGRGTIMT